MQEVPAKSDETSAQGVPEILVKGSKLLNMDIPRSREDAQPYVIFDRAKIESSGAVNLEQFLKQRLTMSTQSASNDQSVNSALGNISEINLRGLGSNQTLILVDGHRLAGVNNQSTPLQPDINGIPLSAIERIEVLPTTASGIYGGGATGGVINIILRRDYSGIEAGVTYENTFATDAPLRRIDFSSGFALEGGRTDILLAGTYSDTAVLTLGERDFLQRGRARILANNPGSYFNAANPPLGATPNIRSVNGSPLFGPGTSYFTSVPVGYGGGGGLAPLQANAGRYNLDLANTAQPQGGGEYYLQKASTVESVTATVRRDFTANLQLFLDGSFSRNTSEYPSSSGLIFTIPVTAPINPFGQAVQVTVPNPSRSYNDSVSSDRRVVGGAVFKLPGNWKAETDYTWNRTRMHFFITSFALANMQTAVNNGTINVLRDTNLQPLDLSGYGLEAYVTPLHLTLQDATVRLAGPVLSLPGGPLTLSTLLEHRKETSDDAFFFGSASTNYYPTRDQSVDSAYLELRLPWVSPQNGFSAIHELELQIAARHDAYTVNGSTSNVVLPAGTTAVPPTAVIVRDTKKVSSTDPTFGIRYKPVEDLILRASYGTGFLPPTVVQLTRGPTSTSGAGVFDPRRGNTPSGAIQQAGGGNPGLQPENSESWSMGAVLTPRVLPGARLSVDYTRIKKSDNIVSLTIQQIVNNESLLPGRVVRGPVPANDPYGVGPITFVDLSRVNVANAELEAYDVALDYSLETAIRGRFDFYAAATWQPHYRTQLIPGAPYEEIVGFGTGLGSVNPLKFKANAGVGWRFRDWTLGWNLRYFDSYLVANPAVASSAPVILSQGDGGRIPSQIYHDIVASYRFPARTSPSGLLSGLLADTQVQLGIKNVFDTQPPFDAGNTYFLYSSFADPRLSSYYINLKRGF